MRGRGGFSAPRWIAGICLVPLPRISIPVPREREKSGKRGLHLDPEGVG